MTIDQLRNWADLHGFYWQADAEGGIRMYRGEADMEEVYAEAIGAPLETLERASNLMARRYCLVPPRIALHLNHTKE